MDELRPEEHHEQNDLTHENEHSLNPPAVEPELTPAPEPVGSDALQPLPSEPPVADAAPEPMAVEQPAVPEEPKPGVVQLDPTVRKQSFVSRAFSKENKFGRAMRWLGKALLITLALLLAGLVIGFFAFYKPLNDNHKLLTSDYQAVQTEVASLKDLVVEKDKVTSGLQGQVGDLQDSLDSQALEVEFLRLKNQVMQARFLAANRDRAGTVTAVKDAQAMAKELKAPVQERLGNQEDVMEVIDRRLALVVTEINSDLPSAVNDLEKVYTRLLELEGSLFK